LRVRNTHRHQRPETQQLAGSTVIAMFSTVRSDNLESGTGTALVPLMPTLQWIRKAALPRPDPSFVTQLIANAEHLPQASRLRRASSEDAQMAYGPKRPLSSVTTRTRQVA
jgi:hypothetical protein